MYIFSYVYIIKNLRALNKKCYFRRAFIKPTVSWRVSVVMYIQEHFANMLLAFVITNAGETVPLGPQKECYDVSKLSRLQMGIMSKWSNWAFKEWDLAMRNAEEERNIFMKVPTIREIAT